ncbi:hypothetical protein MTO96_012062 [Rhipicephalus appendiculatus]
MRRRPANSATSPRLRFSSTATHALSGQRLIGRLGPLERARGEEEQNKGRVEGGEDILERVFQAGLRPLRKYRVPPKKIRRGWPVGEEGESGDATRWQQMRP